MQVASRWNFFLAPRFRFLLNASPFRSSQRAAYGEVCRQWVKARHPMVVAECKTGIGALLDASVSTIGVHKRVYTPGTAEYQGSRVVLTTEGFVQAVRLLMREATVAVTHVFLATDDDKAEAVFREAFGAMLLVRRGVQRVGGGLNADGTLNEVHIKSPHNPRCGLQDAADVLCDALLLAKCTCVLHMDSNVTSAVGMMSSDCQMEHVTDVIARANGGAVPPGLVQHGYYADT